MTHAEAVQALQRIKAFIEYARYELEPKLMPGSQFPSQECADKELARLDAVLAYLQQPAPTPEGRETAAQGLVQELLLLADRAERAQLKTDYFRLLTGAAGEIASLHDEIRKLEARGTPSAGAPVQAEPEETL